MILDFSQCFVVCVRTCLWQCGCPCRCVCCCVCGQSVALPPAPSNQREDRARTERRPAGKWNVHKLMLRWRNVGKARVPWPLPPVSPSWPVHEATHPGHPAASNLAHCLPGCADLSNVFRGDGGVMFEYRGWLEMPYILGHWQSSRSSTPHGGCPTPYSRKKLASWFSNGLKRCLPMSATLKL